MNYTASVAMVVSDREKSPVFGMVKGGLLRGGTFDCLPEAQSTIHIRDV